MNKENMDLTWILDGQMRLLHIFMTICKCGIKMVACMLNLET